MIDDVGALLRATARTAVLPYYRHLASADVRTKPDGDLVTVADEHAERLLTAGLKEILPGSRVVGEEAVAADPLVLDALRGTGAVWLVDPVDGTANFAAGQGPFMMLVALQRHGITEHAYLLDPVADRLLWATRGGGAFEDGRRLWTADAHRPAIPRGAVSVRSLPARVVARARAAGVGDLLPGLRCAGREYPDIVDGTQDFTVFWWTRPWDHASGTLLVTEAGGMARRLDGTPYDPADSRQGLLAASSEAVWHRVAGALADAQGRPKP